MGKLNAHSIKGCFSESLPHMKSDLPKWNILFQTKSNEETSSSMREEAKTIWGCNQAQEILMKWGEMHIL